MCGNKTGLRKGICLISLCSCVKRITSLFFYSGKCAFIPDRKPLPRLIKNASGIKLWAWFYYLLAALLVIHGCDLADL